MRQHVLIVDDDELTLKLLASIAHEIEGVVVHPFVSSVEALKWMRGKDIACFVFDCDMPPPDGMQLAAIVRALDEFKLVPIVIVTGAHERAVRYQALDAGATDFIQKPVDYRQMVARLGTLLALQAAQKKLAMRVDALEASLLDAEERSRQHAERLEALWRIANNPSLREEEMMTAILQVGAGAIRPGQAYLGTLCRVDGETLHVISEAEAAGYERKPGAVSSPVGTVMPLTETFVGVLLDAGGGTRSWEDLEASDAIANPAYARVRGLGWRALITTTFVAGATTYSLAFTSATPAAKPFGSQDRAFIEVLASFFSAYFQQHWQSTRIGHQLEHDSLTGVRNRMRLRSLGRAAFDRKTPAAIAIVNLVQMQRLNETYGHLTGDAVLVEVAAALTSKALEGEIVARVGGSTFAIFFPSAPSRDWVAEAVQRFGATFDARMGIGDREGKESLPVSARIGFARAPDDAQTFDELLLSAEGRARTTSLHPDQRSFPVG